MNIFFLSAQELDLHENLLKLGGRVAMAREGQLGSLAPSKQEK
jgi:hypothetical protein